MKQTGNQEVHYGLANICFGETAITEIDGQTGRLSHRGYPIQDLVRHPYERLVFLLLEGNWPSAVQVAAYSDTLASFRELPGHVVELIERQKDAPADIVLQTCLSYLSGCSDDVPEHAIVSFAPSIVAIHGAIRQGRQPLPPNPNLGVAEDFLRRLLGRPVSKLEAAIINADFVLHADHGANASTFVARIATSTLTSPLRSIVAAIAAFSGLRHGGAIAGVADMLDGLTLEEIPSFVQEQNQATAPVMGFGHRVYKVEDPRASLFLKAADDLSLAIGDRSMLAKVDALVEAMKPYRRFGISPNVDLYAAVIYRLLGIDSEQFTALFAIARVAGWLAQIQEQRKGSNVLIRPRLRYVGHEGSSFNDRLQR